MPERRTEGQARGTQSSHQSAGDPQQKSQSVWAMCAPPPLSHASDAAAFAPKVPPSDAVRDGAVAASGGQGPQGHNCCQMEGGRSAHVLGAKGQ